MKQNFHVIPEGEALTPSRLKALQAREDLVRFGDGRPMPRGLMQTSGQDFKNLLRAANDKMMKSKQVVKK